MDLWIGRVSVGTSDCSYILSHNHTQPATTFQSSLFPMLSAEGFPSWQMLHLSEGE